MPGVNEFRPILLSFLFIQRPCQIEEQEALGCSCFAKIMSVTVQTDRSGYCPGESIVVSVFINNQSSSGISYVEILLLQISVYTIKPGESYCSSVLISFMANTH